MTSSRTLVAIFGILVAIGRPCIAIADDPTIDVGGCRMYVGEGLINAMKRDGGRQTWDGACNDKGMVEGQGMSRRYDGTGRLVHISMAMFRDGQIVDSVGTFDLLKDGRIVSSGLPVDAAAVPVWAQELVSSAGIARPPALKVGSKLLLLRDAIESNPSKRIALVAILKNVAHPEWIDKYDFSGQGDPGEVVAIGGVNYEFFEQCEPHNCGANQMLVLFREDTAWVATISDKRVAFYGDPKGAVREFLERRARESIPN